MSGIATAMVGAAIIGGVSSNNASKKAAASAADSTRAQEGVAQAELAFAKEQHADNKIRFAAADALTEKVTTKQLQSMDQNMALADDYDKYNKSTFRPLEQGIVEDAKKYDSPEEQERAAGAASAAVQQNISKANEANARTLARMGVNPASGRALAIQQEAAITGALGEASAENAARQGVKTLGAAKRMDAASLGRNLPSAQATSAGLGITAGTSAVNAAATNNNAAIAGARTVGGLYSDAASQFSTAASNYGNVAGAAASASAGWGQIGGMALNYALNKAAPTAPPKQGG